MGFAQQRRAEGVGPADARMIVANIAVGEGANSEKCRLAIGYLAVGRVKTVQVQAEIKPVVAGRLIVDFGEQREIIGVAGVGAEIGLDRADRVGDLLEIDGTVRVGLADRTRDRQLPVGIGQYASIGQAEVRGVQVIEARVNH